MTVWVVMARDDFSEPSEWIVNIYGTEGGARKEADQLTIENLKAVHAGDEDAEVISFFIQSYPVIVEED